MIIIKNRKLLIPEDERYIGTTADSNSEVLTFRIDRYTQTEMDLSTFTAKADVYHCDSETTDRADLEMEVQEDYILLFLYITAGMVATPGSVLIDIKAFNDDGTVKWSSYKGAFYVEDPLSTPSATSENLTELEQLEARVNRAIATANERAIETAENWLEENIGEIEGYVIDKSLSVKNAAADAKSAGNAISAEATRAKAAEATLQANINAEASARATGDAALQSQINQLVAPSGEAPSAAEVQNARVGADGTVYSTLGDAIRGQVTDLSDSLDVVDEAVKITKNLVSEIVVGKYANYNNSGVIIDTSANRSYVKVPVKGGHTYSVSAQFSGNFSFWAYENNGTEYGISKISSFETNYVITAPSNATILYLSNIGWNANTQIVVLECDYSIIGTKLADYPFDTTVKVEIKKQSMLYDTADIIGIEKYQYFQRGGVVTGAPPAQDNNSEMQERRIRTPIAVPIILNAGDSLSINGAANITYNVLLSGGSKTNWITADYVAPVYGRYWVEIRHSDNSVITTMDELSYCFTINRKDSILSSQITAVAQTIRNTLGCESPSMEIGNYNYVDGQSTPGNSSYMADRRARSVGSIHLNVGDIVTINDSQTLNYELKRYDDTSSAWVGTGWTSNDTVIAVEADYYVVIYKLGNQPISNINELISDFCIAKAEYAGYVFNQLQKINTEEEESLPDYYYENDYWPDKLTEIKNSMNFSNGVCFAFITDAHFPSNREHSGLMLQEILQKTNIPFVIYGGDTPALFGNENQVDAAITTLIEYMSLVGKDNWYAVRGNHDLYCRTNETPTTVYSKTGAETYNAMIRPVERFVTNMDPSHMCYCIDIPAQKTRFVMLNSSDVDAATGGGNYTTAQLMWLVSVLKNVSNTKIVIISHIPSDSVLASTEASVTAPVQNILSAMQNKETVTVGSTEYSFADSTNQIICHINGHKHQDLYNFENNILSVVTTCDAAYTDDGEGYVANTITEQAFDVYMLDYDNGIVKTIRCGRGSNRAWTYANGNEVTL